MFSNTKNSIDQVPTAAMRPVKKDSRFLSVIKLKTRRCAAYLIVTYESALQFSRSLRLPMINAIQPIEAVVIRLSQRVPLSKA